MYGDNAFRWRTNTTTDCEPVSIVGRLCGAYVYAASAPRGLVSDGDCVLGLFCTDMALGNLRIGSVIQNVVEAEMVSACYDMLLGGTAMRDLFALPPNGISFGFCYVWICRVRIDK